MQLTTNKQNGFSIIEILVSLAIGMLLLGAAGSMGLASLSNSKHAVSINNAQQELQTTMNTLTRELRRAGYRKDEDTFLSGSVPTPSLANFRKIWFFNGTGENEHDCVVFRYDMNASTNLTPPGDNIVNANEIRGIRFKDKSGTTPARIYFLTSASTNAQLTSPVGLTCDNAGDWTELTSGKNITFLDNDRSITPAALALKIDYTTQNIRLSDNATISAAQAGALATADKALVVDQVTITLTGKAANGNPISLSESVQLRNRPFKQ